MHLIQVDSPEDPKNGLHLERVLNKAHMRFIRQESAVIEALANFTQPQWDQFHDQKNLFEVVAVVPVGLSYEDEENWTFGSGFRGEIKAGQHYIKNNNVQLWIRDSDKRPSQHCTDIFLESFAPLCEAGYIPPFDDTGKEKRRECQTYIQRHLRDGLVMYLQRRRYEARDLMTQLQELERGNEVLNQFLIWNC